MCLLITDIFSAPLSNVTVPLNSSAKINFTCNGRGTFVFWEVNDTEILLAHDYQSPYIDLFQIVHSNGTVTIILAVTVSYATNNTRISCRTETIPPDPAIPNEKSTTVILTIAGMHCTDFSLL